MTARLLAAPPDAHPQLGVEWDDSPCPLCGNRDEEPQFEAADPTPADDRPGLKFLVVKCRACGLTYTNPRPSADDIARFYPSNYKPHRRPRKLEQARPRTHPLEKLLGRPCSERRGVLPWPGVGRLLDFGCGGGSFLKRMADQGWDVVGLDAAVGAVRTVQEDLRLKAMVGSLPHPDLRPCSFEVITMWHSLEHVHDPVGVLREAYRLLIPGGRLVIACPNIDSWAFRRFGPDWFGLDLPRHLTHFTPVTLSLAVQSAGLRVMNIRTIRHSDWLRSSAKLAARGPRADWTDKVLTWKPAAKLAAWAVYTAGGSDCLLAVAERPK
jgi:SAM-dependent methyltransferase